MLLRGFLFVSCFFLMASVITAHGFESFDHIIGDNEAILLADPDGNILYSKNADQKMIPASTIKILTGLASFHFLGKDYRFKTEFYLDDQKNLVIKGLGDPLLISEVIDDITKQLASVLPKKIHNLIADDSHFSQPLTIPDISSTSRPYNAPNGALCVNFNTVNFRHGSVPGTYVSAEPQTPLLPFAIKRIAQLGHQSNRVVLSHDHHDITLYAGHLFGYFLKKNGVNIQGQVLIGKANKERAHLILEYHSRYTVEQITRELLEYSNNFIANQLVIAIGAETHGVPADLNSGVDAVKSYVQTQLGIDHVDIVEGSGISRDNRICARDMLKILDAFRPHFQLMRKEQNAFYKTGTLHGVNNRVGFIQGTTGQLYPFVIFINRPGKSSKPLMEMLIRNVN